MSFPRRYSFDDLHSAALVGAWQASERYNADKANGKSENRWAYEGAWHGIQDWLRKFDFLTRTQRGHVNDGTWRPVFLVDLQPHAVDARRGAHHDDDPQEAFDIEKFLAKHQYLTPPQREAVRLMHYGQSQAAISKMLNISDGATSCRVRGLRRALVTKPLPNISAMGGWTPPHGESSCIPVDLESAPRTSQADLHAANEHVINQCRKWLKENNHA